MVDIKHVALVPQEYIVECQNRGKAFECVHKAIELYTKWKNATQELDKHREIKNDFNKQVVGLQSAEKDQAIARMKDVSERIRILEGEVNEYELGWKSELSHIPSLSWEGVPIGKSDVDNQVIATYGEKKNKRFDYIPYYQLPWYNSYISHHEGVSVMGSRGYYIRGDIALFQRALFNYAESVILKYGFELFYPPVMLNEKVMTQIGNLPDFDGQLYEVSLGEGKSLYLIPSSEQSLMSYYAGKNLDTISKPILVCAHTTCFRKEAGSYGKDQQGILRVHQFQKIEMNAICTPQDNDKVFELFGSINEEIFNSLGLHYRKMEVCTGDLPSKHRRQVDYEAWFPGEQKYREICSNGSASDYQNRGLGISFIDQNGEKKIPWSLNCTGITFRTGLALLEQNQQEDGSVHVPEVLRPYFGKEVIK